MAAEQASLLLARDTAANWTSNNPTLGSGEIGVETDTGCWKVGDGATTWASLGYPTQPTVSAMPWSPATGQRVWRGDLGFEFFYDGTRWLTVDLMTLEFGYTRGNTSTTSDSIIAIQAVPQRGVFGLCMETVAYSAYKGTSGTWNLEFTWQTINTRNIIDTEIITNTSSFMHSNAAINSVLSASAEAFDFYVNETSGASGIYPCATLYYRLIAPPPTPIDGGSSSARPTDIIDAGTAASRPTDDIDGGAA